MIRIALTGCGYWGSRLLKAVMRTPGMELVSVYDEDPARLQQVRSTYGDAFSYAGSYEELLKEDAVEAVAVAVPTGAHFQVAEQALAEGKHVFIEKPFTQTLAQAQRLSQLARDRERRIHVDHIMIYHPAIRKIKELLAQGELGEIRYMEMRRSSFGGARADVTVLQDLSVHDLSIIDYLTDGEEPVEARSLSERLGFSQPSIAFTVLKYPGFSAQLTASWVSPVKERRLVLGGAERTLVFDEGEAPDRLLLYRREAPEDPAVVQLAQGDALDSSLAAFCTCVEFGAASPSDGDSAVRIMKILEEI